ncbi:IS21 family transposase [Salicibibacter cibarius]|uniref:IS21 family transposase n=1 Tax=Salicibibacter cibarius TaxID=2743000 RepID=A0A7T6Z161_9BACI|nr:IS21 family transposase [Salicibibacter cibarius]QQK74888.1 IS21 family transposase [Salicibibacter cibarius]
MNDETREEVFWMIQDLHKKGWSITAIAEEMQVSWPTAKKYTEEIPKKQTRPTRKSKLDPHKDYLEQRIKEGTTNCEVLFDELRERGYTGKKTILKDYIKPFRKEPGKQGIPRYETEPGEQAQVDWMDCGIREMDGVRKRTYGFVITMSYSRKRYLCFTTDMKMDTFLRCMMQAFDYYGGIPQKILFDNMKTVVQQRLKKEIILTSEFNDFAFYYGFRVDLCQPGKPRTKGKVENSVKYVRNNFLQRRHEPSLEIWNYDALQWLSTVANANPNQTTGVAPDERFQEERGKLQPITGIKPYIVTKWEKRIVHDGYISVKSKRYSVPSRPLLKEVRIRWMDRETFEIWDNEQKITTYTVDTNPQKTVVYRSEHLPKIKGTPDEGDMGLATAPHVQKAPNVEVRSLDYYENLKEEESTLCKP